MQSLPRAWAPSSLNEVARCARERRRAPVVAGAGWRGACRRGTAGAGRTTARVALRVRSRCPPLPSGSRPAAQGSRALPRCPRCIAALRTGAGRQAPSGRRACQQRAAFQFVASGPHGLLGWRAMRSAWTSSKCGPLPDMHALARANFAAVEVRALLALPAHLQQDGFFACWTRKEAVIKALGGGLSIPLAEFDVSVDPRDPASDCTRCQAKMRHSAWTLWGEERVARRLGRGGRHGRAGRSSRFFAARA